MRLTLPKSNIMNLTNIPATGPKNSYKVKTNLDGEWTVLATDNNGVWVIAEPGTRYKSKEDAIAAAEGLAEGEGNITIEE